MTTTDFIHKAKKAVARVSGYTAPNIQPVWSGYILGNMKAILTTIDDDRQELYEVTYNRASSEIYVDRYTKVSNHLYPVNETTDQCP